MTTCDPVGDWSDPVQLTNEELWCKCLAESHAASSTIREADARKSYRRIRGKPVPSNIVQRIRRRESSAHAVVKPTLVDGGGQ